MRKRTKITMDPKYILMMIAIVCVALIIVSFRLLRRCSAESIKLVWWWQMEWTMPRLSKN